MKTRLKFIVVALEACLLLVTASLCPAQNPLVALEDAAKEKLAEQAIEALLNNQLPLTLNADSVYPTVANLPGGPFSPTPLKLTAAQLDQPLLPGDYMINTLDFCSEYSVHAPGAGVAYVLGPYEGKAAGAISALIWRGTVQYQINPNSLQAVSWAIQSGLAYAQMPKSYQAIVDQVIPDFKTEISGDFVVNLESTYNTYAKTAKLPPLDTILAKLGKPGELALSAERQRAILLRQNTNDQIRDQTLFQGQQAGLYTPVKAENGPWTERVKGQVYMKLQIAGGNMAANNVMQIRVMPTAAINARYISNGPHLVLASYGEPQAASSSGASATSVTGLMQGMLGYSQGRGAQALGQVPVPAPGGLPPGPPPPSVAGTVKDIDGPAYVKRAGSDTWTPLNPGDSFSINDVLQSPSRSTIDIEMADGTDWTIGSNSEWNVQNYQYNQPSLLDDVAKYQVLQGTYLYIGGLLDKNPPGTQVDACEIYGGDHFGCGSIGIRGTEFVLKVDPTAKTMEIDLIKGAVAVTPAGSTTAGPTINAPAQIKVAPTGMQLLPLTQDQYNTIKAQVKQGVPTT